MKIELDTKHDTKEEMMHLANMLHALSGTEGSRTYPNKLQRKIAKARNIFEDLNPSVGSSSINSTPVQNQPASGGLFDMFGSASSASASTSIPEQPTIQEPIVNSNPVETYSIFGSTENTDTKDDDKDEPAPAIVPY